MRNSANGQQALELGPTTGHRCNRNQANLLDAIKDVFFILKRAQSAARLYEDLDRRCGAALAEQGLKRADVPRAIYKELTKGY